MPTGSWFYFDRGQQYGPVATEELASWILGAHLPRDVQVWREGLAEWTAADTVPEIASHLQPPPAGFFLMGAGGPQGPIDVPVIMTARAGRIGRETMVWRPGLPEWISAGALPEWRRTWPPRRHVLRATRPRPLRSRAEHGRRGATPEGGRHRSDGPCHWRRPRKGPRARMV